jgi:outer membrane lipoprotein-sorting protein
MRATGCAEAQDADPNPPTRPDAASPGDGAFEKRIESIDRAMEKIVDLRADFEQRKHTPLLKKPMISRGSLLVKGQSVRWDTREPRRSTMRISNGRLRMYYPDDQLLEVYPVREDMKDLGGAPLPRLLALRARFEITAASVKELGAEEGNPHLLAVLLVPKGEEMRRHVQSVRVLIDDTGPVATRVVMTDAEGETTEISFSHIRINAGVEQDEIELHLPEGVRVSHPLGE